MKTVFKYPLSGQDSVFMPKGARILHGELQDGMMTLWALVERNAAMEIRHFAVYGTGHDIDDTHWHEHISTVFNGPFVWHVFEVHKDD